MNDKIKRAVIYIRVSTEEQVKHGYSLKAQKERLLEYCKERNYKVIDIYADEGKSARSNLRSRTELQRLIKDVEERKFDIIVFWRLDRWFRNISDYYKVQEILEKNKVDWECSDEEYNTTTSNGRLHLNIKLSIAQNESDQTSDRIKFNFANMVKNGKAICGTKSLPLGYMVVGEKGNKKIVKNENEIEIVEDMFRNIKITRSMRKTLFYMNNKYNLTMDSSTIKRYLKNQLYIGRYRDNYNYCEAYLTKNEFDEIQKIVTHNVKNNSRYDYIFSGLLVCKKCGRRLSGSSHLSYASIKSGRKRYMNRMYRCNRNNNDGLCDNTKSALENVVEKKIFEEVENFIKKYKIKNKKVEEKKERKKIDVKKVQQKIDRLNELYIEGKINKEKYDSSYNNYMTTIENASKKEKKTDFKHIEKLLDNDVKERYYALTNVEKRAFWGSFIDRIEIDKEHFDIFFVNYED